MSIHSKENIILLIFTDMAVPIFKKGITDFSNKTDLIFLHVICSVHAYPHSFPHWKCSAITCPFKQSEMYAPYFQLFKKKKKNFNNVNGVNSNFLYFFFLSFVV